MKIEFKEVETLFEKYIIYNNSKEMLFYQKAWEIFSESKCNEYSNEDEALEVYLKAYNIILFYKEFCDLNFEELDDYEFWDFDEIKYISKEKLIKFAKEAKLEQEFEDDLEGLFFEWINKYRKEVFYILKNGFKSIEKFYAYLFLGTEESNLNIRELNPFRIYNEKALNFEISKKDKEKEGYNWLMEGTYRVR